VEFASKSSSSQVQLFLIQSLTNSPSSVLFDSLTHTKTVATLIHKVPLPLAGDFTVIYKDDEVQQYALRYSTVCFSR